MLALTRFETPNKTKLTGPPVPMRAKLKPRIGGSG